MYWNSLLYLLSSFCSVHRCVNMYLLIGSQSCLKQVVLCAWAPLGQFWATAAPGTARADLYETPQPWRATQWQQAVLAQLLSWPLQRLWHSCLGWLCLCVCFLKVCQNCQLVCFSLLFSCYNWRTKVGWKARIFLSLICPSPFTLTYVLVFCWLTWC